MPKLRKVRCSLYTLSFSFSNHPLKLCGSTCSWLQKKWSICVKTCVVPFESDMRWPVSCFSLCFIKFDDVLRSNG